MKLNEAIRLSDTACLALTGAGGKTTALFQLARSLSSGPGASKSGTVEKPVIVAATTHLHIDQVHLADSHWILREPADLAALEKNLQGVMLVTGPLSADRTTGLNDHLVSLLHAVCISHSLPLLIEADGSHRRPLKAPAEHEPPIPPFVETVMVVAGLSGLGRPLTAEFIHRPEIFSRLSGLALGETVTEEALLRVLTHPDGGLKNIPAHAQRLVLLNQADTPELQAMGGKLSQALLTAFDAVLVGMLKRSNVQTFERSAGIILAAGEARRFGQSKQLLDYRGQPFVRAVAQTALAGGLSPVVVVTGANAQAVEAALQDLPITIARNLEWQSGQSSSIKTGLQALPRSTVPPASHNQVTSPNIEEFWGGREGLGAAIFLLADQPQVTSTVLRALVEQHTLDLPPILAPLVNGQRANPVLFDRRVFKDLMALSGDVGGRGVFSKYQVAYLPWHDESLLLDVDTQEDLQRLRDQEE